MKTILTLLILMVCHTAVAQESSLPIIDIHLHAYDIVPQGVPASWAGEPEAQALTSPANADQHLQDVLTHMSDLNIVMALTSSTTLSAIQNWKETAPGLFIGGIQTDEQGNPIVSPDSLRILKENGDIDVLGELGFQYSGLNPSDPRFDRYYEVAEESSIPVCLHTGLGPPGGPHSFAPDFRTTLGRPSLFEPVLARHPNLKVILSHAGWPYITETIALMYIYPDLYADIGVLSWALPTKAFHSALEELMVAGFGKRIVFGTDQMIWPGAIPIAVQSVREAPFLSEQEKRDILYNNAARFLELDEETIAKHHE